MKRWKGGAYGCWSGLEEERRLYEPGLGGW